MHHMKFDDLLTVEQRIHLGGFCGFFYVASNIIAVPRLGVGTSLALFVCSQVI